MVFLGWGSFAGEWGVHREIIVHNTATSNNTLIMKSEFTEKNHASFDSIYLSIFFLKKSYQPNG